jgi:hypothetical protein
MNRRIKAERDVITFVRVCSRVTGMHLHHSQGTKQAQAQISEYERMERVVFNALAKEMSLVLPVLNPFTDRSLGTTALDWTCYSGAGDGVGEAASVAGDRVGAVVAVGAAGAGNTAPLNIFDLRCFWLCNCSGACGL